MLENSIVRPPKTDVQLRLLIRLHVLKCLTRKKQPTISKIIVHVNGRIQCGFTRQWPKR